MQVFEKFVYVCVCVSVCVCFHWFVCVCSRDLYFACIHVHKQAFPVHVEHAEHVKGRKLRHKV